ncbi:unnamed protein product [Ectocarpus sp. 12 AP-2014]
MTSFNVALPLSVDTSTTRSRLHRQEKPLPSTSSSLTPLPNLPLKPCSEHVVFDHANQERKRRTGERDKSQLQIQNKPGDGHILTRVSSAVGPCTRYKCTVHHPKSTCRHVHPALCITHLIACGTPKCCSKSTYLVKTQPNEH